MLSLCFYPVNLRDTFEHRMGSQKTPKNCRKSPKIAPEPWELAAYAPKGVGDK
jgi:hypothetical protein